MRKKEISVGISDGLFEEVLATAYSPIVTLSELVKNSSDACYIKKDKIVVEIDTINNAVVIKDNGKGLSFKDIEELSSVGKSQKMTNGNVLSQIGEPYAGSKGLGILTAFNLCDYLEIITHSLDDDKTYFLDWKKGTKKIRYSEYSPPRTGTLLTMKGVSNDDIKMITRQDEINKLFLSSITYYMNSDSLPSIEVYIDNKKIDYQQRNTLEDIYQKHNKPRTKLDTESYFVSKATFKYCDNELILSHEDNVHNVCSFENEKIYLTELDTVRDFLSRHNIIFQNLEARLGNFDTGVKVDDFDGVYYVWRHRKSEDLTYPYGIKIYVNNYGLYNYLGQTNDWTQFSEISQNIRNTNYKFKNTYGYVIFRNFNEEHSHLKISKERNDFIGNLARIKFYHTMRGFVSGIFSSIDITLKKNKGHGASFVLLQENRKTTTNKVIDVRDLIRTDLPTQQLLFTHDDNIEIDREKGLIYTKAEGKHELQISNGNTTFTIFINAENPTPNFELPKIPHKVSEGDTVDLLKLVKLNSLKNVVLNKISIESDNALVDRNIFKRTNKPGSYQIRYIYNSEGHPEICKTHTIIVTNLHEDRAKKIRKLFPNYQTLKDYHKLNEIAEQISISYSNSPVICGIALRSLLEITIRHFIEDILKAEPEKEIKTLHKIHYILNLLNTNDARLDDSIKNEYKDKLLRNRNKLVTYYDRLDINSYVHDSESMMTESDILNFSRMFKNFLEFLFNSLANKQ